jgi:hypothetical protein
MNKEKRHGCSLFFSFSVCVREAKLLIMGGECCRCCVFPSSSVFSFFVVVCFSRTEVLDENMQKRAIHRRHTLPRLTQLLVPLRSSYPSLNKNQTKQNYKDGLPVEHRCREKRKSRIGVRLLETEKEKAFTLLLETKRGRGKKKGEKAGVL